MNSIFQTTKCLSAKQIKEFLNQELSNDDQYQVENHILDCALCSAAIEGFANTYTSKKALEDDLADVRQKRTAKQNTSTKKTEVRRIPFNQIAAAAAILLIPLATFFYYNSNSNEQAFASFYKTAENDGSIALRGDGDGATRDKALDLAMQSYEKSDFSYSLTALDKYLIEHPENGEARFYAGISAIETGDFEKAIRYLTSVRINEEKYYEEATWYLILANVKTENITMAKNLISDLDNIENGRFASQLKDLKATLN